MYLFNRHTNTLRRGDETISGRDGAVLALSEAPENVLNAHKYAPMGHKDGRPSQNAPFSTLRCTRPGSGAPMLLSPDGSPLTSQFSILRAAGLGSGAPMLPAPASSLTAKFSTLRAVGLGSGASRRCHPLLIPACAVVLTSCVLKSLKDVPA